MIPFWGVYVLAALGGAGGSSSNPDALYWSADALFWGDDVLTWG